MQVQKIVVDLYCERRVRWRINKKFAMKNKKKINK